MKKALVFIIIGLCLMAVSTFSVFARQEAEQEYKEWKYGTGRYANRGSYRRTGPRPVYPSLGVRRGRRLSSAERRRLKQRMLEIRKKLASEMARKRKLVTLPESEIAKYRNFLAQKNTGIFRLVAFVDCEKKKIVKVGEECANNIPGASMYSLNKKKHTFEFYPSSFEIAYRNGKFVSDGFLTNGIMVSLGDVQLEKVSLDTKGLGFVTGFVPETKNSEAKQQFELLSRGVESEGFYYSNNLEVKLNNTYIVRAVAYHVYKHLKRLRAKNYRRAYVNPQWWRFYSSLKQKRNDSIYAFRVVERSGDKSVTILWKSLEKNKSPRLRFKKKEKLRDFKK